MSMATWATRVVQPPVLIGISFATHTAFGAAGSLATPT